MTRWATGMRSRLRWQKWNPRPLGAAVTSCTEKGALESSGRSCSLYWSCTCSACCVDLVRIDLKPNALTVEAATRRSNRAKEDNP